MGDDARVTRGPVYVCVRARVCVCVDLVDFGAPAVCLLTGALAAIWKGLFATNECVRCAHPSVRYGGSVSFFFVLFCWFLTFRKCCVLVFIPFSAQFKVFSPVFCACLSLRLSRVLYFWASRPVFSLSLPLVSPRMFVIICLIYESLHSPPPRPASEASLSLLTLQLCLLYFTVHSTIKTDAAAKRKYFVIEPSFSLVFRSRSPSYPSEL